MALSSGDLRERIKIEAFTRVSDGGGGYTEEWATLPGAAKVPAKVIAKSGQEAVIADRPTAVFTTLFVIRNRLDLDETMRIVWRGRVMNIRGIRREGFGPAFLTLEAQGGVAT